MYCSNCGNRVEENQKFCSVCGTEVVRINNEIITEQTTSKQSDCINNSEQTRGSVTKQEKNKKIGIIIAIVCLSIGIIWGIIDGINNMNKQTDKNEKTSVASANENLIADPEITTISANIEESSNDLNDNISQDRAVEKYGSEFLYKAGSQYPYARTFLGDMQYQEFYYQFNDNNQVERINVYYYILVDGVKEQLNPGINNNSAYTLKYDSNNRIIECTDKNINMDNITTFVYDSDGKVTKTTRKTIFHTPDPEANYTSEKTTTYEYTTFNGKTYVQACYDGNEYYLVELNPNFKNYDFLIMSGIVGFEEQVYQDENVLSFWYTYESNGYSYLSNNYYDEDGNWTYYAEENGIPAIDDYYDESYFNYNGMASDYDEIKSLFNDSISNE